MDETARPSDIPQTIGRYQVQESIGYGAMGRPPKIPPNSTLLFDVELVGIR